MRVYRERLGAPATWWLVAAGFVLLFGTTLLAGLSITTGVAAYAALAALCTTTLLVWGHATIEVTDAELHAGSQRIPLERIGLVTALNAAQARELRGPRADPAAYLLIRPYLTEAVYVEVAGKPTGRPYWLVGTRHPAELAAAIERARLHGGHGTSWHDVAADHAAAAGDHAATAAAPGPAGEPSPGKDSNAW